jgi:hypothetical protein
MIKRVKNDGGDDPEKNKQDAAAGSNKSSAEQRAAKEVADKVGFLFDTFKNPDTGEVYTFRDVEAATEGKLSYHWLWKLANANFSSPGLNYLKLLTDFFQVDPKLWFRDLDEGLKGELVRERDYKLGKAKPQEVYGLALRSTSFDSLEPEEKQLIVNMIEALKKNKENDK